MDDHRSPEEFIGFLEVCIHKARDIHNICIYQNQDVYAKFCLTDKPEEKISSQVVNGGGRNPVFNETMRLGVRTLDSSLRCEVWMLSRIRNYLEDQLLGFALVPLSEVVSENEKPAREFELSSSELFHSPAGLLELSFKYVGTSPEVVEIPLTSCSSVAIDLRDNGSCELDRIEFPDQEVAKENERMVSEYLSFPCNQMEPCIAGSCCSLEKDNNLMSVKTDVRLVEKQEDDVVQTTEVSPSNDSSCSVVIPAIDVAVQPEGKVVQEEIVDMYMKGMQQFTDALAKMKLPMENITDGSSTKEDVKKRDDSGSDGKAQASKVFYGSRAFF